MPARKTDRRTLITKSLIKDALLELLHSTPYEKITVTAICKQAEITRATFYLHYDNTDAILDELLDDALCLSELPFQTKPNQMTSGLSVENDAPQSPPPDTFLPACQRAASTPKYKVLFQDESLSHHLLDKLYRLQRKQRVLEIMQKYHLSEWEADKLFIYMLYGNFAVNQSMKWERSPEWYHIQELLREFVKP